MGLMRNIMGGKHLPIFEGVDSLIGQGTRFKGEINTKGSLNVNGAFEGIIRGDGEVIVSSGGKVVGEIHGGSVIVSGRVDGNITAKDTLEIAKSGRVHGDLTGGKILIEEGSVYQGKVRVESVSAETESEPAEAAVPFALPATQDSLPLQDKARDSFPTF